MGNEPETLDYAAAIPHPRLARARKWIKRLTLAFLLLACLYAAPIVWLYWGWKQEQPARDMINRVGGVARSDPCGPALVARLIPERLDWMRRRLAACGIRATGERDVATLAARSQLRTLSLTCSDLGRAEPVLAQLAKLKRLEKLTVGGLVTDASLVHLQQVRSLRCLRIDMWNERVTNAGVASLGRLSQLNELELRGGCFTNEGLMKLSGLRQLQRLLLDFPPVTEQEVEELRKAMPHCQITRRERRIQWSETRPSL